MRRREGGTRGGGRRPDGGDISRRMEGQISSCTLWQFTVTQNKQWQLIVCYILNLKRSISGSPSIK